MLTSRRTAERAAGDLKEIAETSLTLVPDDFLDRTRDRPHSLFDDTECWVRVDFTHPFCPHLRAGLIGAAANQIEPGKRPLSSMSPTVVLAGDLRAGRPVLTVGAAGGPTIISAVVQVVVNRLDLGMPLERALGTIAGAVGSSLDNEESVRKATFSQRVPIVLAMTSSWSLKSLSWCSASCARASAAGLSCSAAACAIAP